MMTVGLERLIPDRGRDFPARLPLDRQGERASGESPPGRYVMKVSAMHVHEACESRAGRAVCIQPSLEGSSV